MLSRLFQKNRIDNPAVTIGMALGAVAVMWSASSYGYYALVDALALANGYNDAPVLFAAYYLLWAAVAFFWFRQPLSEGLAPTDVAVIVMTMLPVFAIFILFVAVFLPGLPPIAFWRAPADPPEFMFASGWYYLPKSADILFQQVLVASMIRTAASLEYRLTTIATGMGLLFGGFHLLLAFDGFSPLYVARFTIAATLFGLVAPYLYLRLNHGFRWAYSLHWAFYAFDATVTHYVLAVPPWLHHLTG